MDLEAYRRNLKLKGLGDLIDMLFQLRLAPEPEDVKAQIHHQQKIKAIVERLNDFGSDEVNDDASDRDYAGKREGRKTKIGSLRSIL